MIKIMRRIAIITLKITPQNLIFLLIITIGRGICEHCLGTVMLQFEICQHRFSALLVVGMLNSYATFFIIKFC